MGKWSAGQKIDTTLRPGCDDKIYVKQNINFYQRNKTLRFMISSFFVDYNTQNQLNFNMYYVEQLIVVIL